MKWIALSILLFIGAYTFITLHYRKPGPAHRPYQDARERATVERLKSAGYRRVTAAADSPAEPQRTAASVKNNPAAVRDIPGGLPAELAETLLDQPHPPAEYHTVNAPAAGNALMPYALQFACTLPDRKSAVAETTVYIKDRDVAIVPHVDAIGNDLRARTRDNAIFVSLPAGTLAAGEYRVTLVGAAASKQWTVQVH